MYKNHNNVLLTEKEKQREDYLIDRVDKIISELVYEKDDLVTAYEYYNGIRSDTQFAYLKTVYGVGTPTKVEFTPLVRIHVDSLVGEYLGFKIKPHITCKDKETLNQIERDKQLNVLESQIKLLRQQLSENVLGFLQGLTENEIKDIASEERLAKLIDDTKRDYVSEFEIAAHHVLKHVLRSKTISLKDKLRLLFLDLLVVGQAFYKVSIDRPGETPTLEVLDPFNTFIESKPNTILKKEGSRAVVRKWLTKTEIVSKYGRYMTDPDIKSLDNLMDSYTDNSNIYYIRSSTSGLIDNLAVTSTGFNYERGIQNLDLFPVYEVEWITTTKVIINGEKDYRLDRHEAVRIGDTIYIDKGEPELVYRSKEKPLTCYLSVNGISYSDRGVNKPYSLVLSTKHLQDKYDLLHFYRDTLIANSGTKGSYLDVATLPAFLGETEQERVLKAIAYKKNGIALMDSSQDGEIVNTLVNGYDETVSAQAVQAIQLAINATEATCSNITGIFRERLGNIEQRDAVSNVEVGIKQSAVITKQYYSSMDKITNEILSDMLNASKISYKDGEVGNIILGDKMKEMFILNPEKFCHTDYDVYIDDTGEIAMDIENIKAVTTELIKAGAIDIDVLLEAMSSHSLTELKENVGRSYNKRKEENDQLQQASQQIDQLNKTMKDMQEQNNQLQRKNEELVNKNLEIKEKELELNYQLAKDKNRIAEQYNKGRLENEEDRTELEKLQMFDNNPYNNTVRK